MSCIFIITDSIFANARAFVFLPIRDQIKREHGRAPAPAPNCSPHQLQYTPKLYHMYIKNMDIVTRTRETESIIGDFRIAA